MINDFPDYKHANVLIYGDVMLDRYWSGDVQRISPEAPVPVVHVEHKEARAGGAANVALNVAALDATVTCMGVVGDDDAAKELATLLHQAKVDDQLQIIPNAQTITKLRVMGQNQQLIRLDFERPEGLKPTTAMLQHYHEALGRGCRVVVLSDYSKGALTSVAEMIASAKLAGCAVLIDPKRQDFSAYRGASLLTPNIREFEAVVGPCGDDVDEIMRKAQQQLLQHDIEAMLITRGSKGMFLVERSGQTCSLAAIAEEVYDVTGAGDTVIAVIAASLAAGQTLQDSVAVANVAAGLVVRKVGSATVSPAELRRKLQALSASQTGVLNEQQALEAVADARAHNETVVMTNGCFDLLHPGHLEYLEQAKKCGHRLLVAVNSDESVRGLKGESRPINALADRMEMLAALRAVDWVVPFSEETPQRLIAALLPDVLVKGGDYTVEQIAGHREVLANGGEVKILSFKPGCSTTGLVEKIRGEHAS